MEEVFEIEEIQRENETYLVLFEEYLTSFGVSQRLKDRYLGDVEYYLNEYLAVELKKHMVNGVRELHNFFMNYFYGNYHIYGITTSEELLERILKSLKLFYRCMHDKKCINDEMYAFFEWIIKENKDLWIEELRRNEKFDSDINDSILGA